ncbi:MAG: hypothetical protein AOA65_1912 [Candidatus Bathyarchaeota archaeon BA1]|nr:MAG: hypothetical protein AOA65_1912 [Candidatus Bathyarchaeota archaeon BA1]
MELIVVIALAIATLFTALASFAQTTKRVIHFLSLQAAAVGFVELMYCFINLIVGLHVEALISFLATFTEWFSCAVVSPLIIYWGMTQTENSLDQPIMGTRSATLMVITIALSHLTLGWWSMFLLPTKLETLPFCALMLSLSVFVMATRKDPLKILAGLNLAENALYPLLAESPLSVIPFLLGLMIFVNLAAVFVIVQAHHEYGTSLITKWRWTS